MIPHGGTSGLLGKRVHIAGSANARTKSHLTRYGHKLIEQVVRGILRLGGGIVLGAGKEPRPIDAASNTPSLVFDWTALKVAADLMKRGEISWPGRFGPPIVVVCSEKSESEIPAERRKLWQKMLDSGLIRLERIQAGARSGAMIRDTQARFGDALIILGGGTGVEHLAKLYISSHRPVLPLDIPIGSSREDGMGGAERLAMECRADPHCFFKLSGAIASTVGARLAGISTQRGNASIDQTGRRVVELLGVLEWPKAFYVRLLSKSHPAFERVESFFRSVVDPVVKDAGLDRIEIGTDATGHAFINVGIFESLHFAAVVIADVTGERPNCFLELGYALGRQARVLVTAEEGTHLPFDQQAIPCHFWKHAMDNRRRRTELTVFWEKYVNRSTVVPE